MLTRVAGFEGAIESGSKVAFFADATARLEPIWAIFPHVRAVRVLRTRESDPGAIPIDIVLSRWIASMADIQDSLASDIKTKAHATTLDVLKPFTGRFFHFITESRELAPGSGG